jgi:hypothetical protein
VASWFRWLHIYLSMFGLASVLFFGVTGLTLNHPDWFFADVETRSDTQGELEPNLLNRPVEGVSPGDDPSLSVDRLAVVELLRKRHHLSGAVSEFRVDDIECMVSLRGPGYSADAFIDRASGRYELSELRYGVVAVLNDLHKGRDTGPAWSVVIDVSAVLLTVIALTGLVLLFYLKLRRKPGVLVAVIGTVVLVLAYVWGVP